MENNKTGSLLDNEQTNAIDQKISQILTDIGSTETTGHDKSIEKQDKHDKSIEKQVKQHKVVNI